MEFEKLREVICDFLNFRESEVTMETLFEDLGADSLDIFQIITELEDIYDMEFDTEEAANIKTVGDAVEFIKIYTRQ